MTALQKLRTAVIAIVAMVLATCVSVVVAPRGFAETAAPGTTESRTETTPALLAIATNFATAADEIARRFLESTRHEVTVIHGSTGKLYAQIVHGAPFDVFLAADQARPIQLENAALAVPGSRFTYASGRLVLWSTDDSLIAADGRTTLAALNFRRLAIANPDLAPYGRAAIQTLEGLGLSEQLTGKLVMGENVGQAYSIVATGNAELGLIAGSSDTRTGSRWDVPETLHEPIRQDAVLLAHGRNNTAAAAFMAFLKDPEILSFMRAAGYRVN